MTRDELLDAIRNDPEVRRAIALLIRQDWKEVGTKRQARLEAVATRRAQLSAPTGDEEDGGRATEDAG